jgi:hypothetical protein
MNKRINDIEFRYVPSKWEIVKWDKRSDGGDYCYTLVLYEKHSEGYEIRFIGDRPFRYENVEKLWALMKYGQKVLDAHFDLEEDWK